MNKEKRLELITSANEWKLARGKTKLLVLPSGVTIKMKEELELLECASTGHIPLPLLNSLFETGVKLSKEGSLGKTTDTELSDMLNVLRRVAVLVVVDPVVSEEPSDGQMNVKDISERDLFAIFGEALTRGIGGNIPDLRPFPKE